MRGNRTTKAMRKKIKRARRKQRQNRTLFTPSMNVMQLAYSFGR